MKGYLLSILFLGIAIAFAATILAGIIKLLLFFRHKDSYRNILKFGLYGEVIGLVLIFFAWCFYSAEINKWNEPEAIIAIPFYLMVIGLIIGTVVTYFDRRKINRQKIKHLLPS